MILNPSKDQPMIKTISKILLADDDIDDRNIFEDLLKEGHPNVKLDYVRNGIELMTFLKNFIPDLLFLDLDMPYKNGLQCLVEIRNADTLKELPVVIFSSTTRPVNIQTAYEMGAHLFLIKSSKMSEYAAALKAILSLNWNNPIQVREQYCLNGRFAAFS